MCEGCGREGGGEACLVVDVRAVLSEGYDAAMERAGPFVVIIA